MDIRSILTPTAGSVVAPPAVGSSPAGSLYIVPTAPTTAARPPVDRTPHAAAMLALAALGGLVVLRYVFRGALD